MKKIALLISITLTFSIMFAQSPCCKNKAKGASCSRSAQAVDATQITDANKVLPACCKSKSGQGASCSKDKLETSVESYSSKKWWQIWKK